ncbi:MAG: sugar phosphate isomerase/epimerase [Oscillospiraceae bacterium]|nr:sugar phosphate isomerase/epimerase [Oscillospiraceae bacterium]
MMMELNVDAHLYCLGVYKERYVPGGYHEEMALHEQLEAISKAGGITGLNATYPTHPLPDDPVRLAETLKGYGLRVSYMLVTNWLDGRFRNGAFSTNEHATLRDSVGMCKRGIDFAKAAGADSVLLWPAQDGFDYPFQISYGDAWKRLTETLTELAEHAGAFRLALEPKPKDPRQKSLINNTGTLLHLIRKIGRDNLGCALDIGHAAAAQESMAASLVQMDMEGRLFQVHLNDNYKDADPDLIMGTINLVETLEMFYYLLQTEYGGWCSIDVILPRDDRVKALGLSYRMIARYKRMAERLLESKAELLANMEGYRFADNADLIFPLILGE